MIVPKFNKSRLGNANSIGDAIKTIAGPIAKLKDKKTKMDVDAANAALKARQKAAAEASKKKKKAIASQDAAAKSYIQNPIKAKKGKTLTPAEKAKNRAIRKQNIAAKSYMSYDPTPVTATGSAGRPNSRASQKTSTPKPPKSARPTVNKTAPRKSKPLAKVTAVAKPKAPAAPGRRKNGAPK